MRKFFILFLVVVCGCKVVDFDNLSKSQIIKYQIEKIEILKKWQDGEEIKYKVREYSPEGNMIIDSGINESYFRDFLILNSYNFRGQLTKSIYYDDDSSVYAMFLYQYYKNGKRKQVKYFKYIDSESDTFENGITYIYKYHNRFQEIFTDEYNDSMQLETRFKYNLIGRKVLVQTPDYNELKMKAFRYNICGKLKSTKYQNEATRYKYDLLGRQTQITYSDSSKRVFKYFDNKLNIKKYLNAKNEITILDSFHYNENGLLTKKISYDFLKDTLITKEINDSLTYYIREDIIDYSVKPTIYIYKYTKRKQ